MHVDMLQIARQAWIMCICMNMYVGRHVYMYAWHHTDGTARSTIFFLLAWHDWNERESDLFACMMPALHLVGQNDWHEVQCDVFQSFNTVGTGISIFFCQWYCQ